MIPLSMLPVDDRSRVAEARRVATAIARDENLDPTSVEEIAIIATELATNLVKHASRGEIHFARLSASGRPGVEILSIDNGPGMTNVAACLEDGYSSSGTAGTGLGAVSRLSTVFDNHSKPGKGTVILSRKYARDTTVASQVRWVFGGVRSAYPGESACGDHWDVYHHGIASVVIVADGLGHGLLAAQASYAAVTAFRRVSTQTPVQILDRVHNELRSTRGAAVAVTRLEEGRNKAVFAGLGNIAGVIWNYSGARHMVSHNGTAGMEARRVQEFEYNLESDSVLVMHSDGLMTSWNLNSYPGVQNRHPSVIAGLLYRDANRGRDDCCVVAGRLMRE